MEMQQHTLHFSGTRTQKLMGNHVLERLWAIFDGFLMFGMVRNTPGINFYRFDIA